MSKYLKYLALGVTHPSELRAVINYAVWHDPLQRIEDDPEASGLSRPEMRRCWEFLDLTSRSFAAVIKELEGELCRVVCLFYLVLRALDTVEDDMTLDTEPKARLLESFHEKLAQPGWNFDGSGPNEKDRQLLVEFEVVIAEFGRLDESYRSVIARICRSMGHGMARYARLAATSSSSYAVDTLADYDLYCHYVAGLVGEGLSALWSASGKEIAELGRMLSLSNSMGLMLQKVNITRDFREDLDDGRFFWPRELWAKYTPDPKAFYEQPDAQTQQKALHALSEMVLDALVHAPDCLDYLSLLRNQSVFNFCAIPQVMAIATLDAVFMNPDVFQKNVKIRKSLAVYLIGKATNPRDVAHIFLQYARSIQRRAVPSDPSYVKLGIAVFQIEQWVETRYPSWIFRDGRVGQLPVFRDDEAAQAIADVRVKQLPLRDGAAPAPRQLPEEGLSWEEKKILYAVMFGLVLFLLAITFGIVGIAYWFSSDLQQSEMGAGISRKLNLVLSWLGRSPDQLAAAASQAASKASLRAAAEAASASAKVEL